MISWTSLSFAWTLFGLRIIDCFEPQEFSFVRTFNFNYSLTRIVWISHEAELIIRQQACMLVMKISVKSKHVPRMWPLSSTKAIKNSSQIDSIAVTLLMVDFFGLVFQALVNPTELCFSFERQTCTREEKSYQNKIENEEVEIEATPKVKQEQLTWQLNNAFL